MKRKSKQLYCVRKSLLGNNLTNTNITSYSHQSKIYSSDFDYWKRKQTRGRGGHQQVIPTYMKSSPYKLYTWIDDSKTKHRQ
jgi:hypothetical protein